ncbi:PREDICTED: O-acyltransferase WSD1-like [Populus euphratica]|uniref:O-acyltransferase WSD1-like n=1 Tax=Populus euphratica TaxID=75702 RepID=A0AAJ6T095_POPEU|nr:PREDICTED: O-acyltransferase WSD1-like [Populus euphratica]
MVLEKEEDALEPVSPSAQYLNSSALNVSVLVVLETEVPIDDSKTIPLVRDVFLPINPRFSSIMVIDENGEKRWKRVEVKLEDHVYVPIFPEEMSPQFYDEYFEDYLSKLSMLQLPQSQPLWEIHLIKYPTSNAAGTVIFKIHHAIGDGYSLMGALLSCLQRADNPSLPLTLPSVQPRVDTSGDHRTIFKTVPQIFSLLFNTVSDFLGSLLKSSLVEDDLSPIRSGDIGIEFRPIAPTTMTFSLGQIKQIKATLGVTINDVITGAIFLGTRLYMQEMSKGSSDHSNCTALVMLNTRMFRSYQSIKEMVKPKAESPWGNHFAFLHVQLPELVASTELNPIEFVRKAQQITKRKRSSLAVYLTAAFVEFMKKLKGHEVAAQYIHKTMVNASMTITNMIGPVEKMSLANHPIKGMYFAVAGNPQRLNITIVSYVDNLRVTVGAEKGFLDAQKLKSCIEKLSR